MGLYTCATSHRTRRRTRPRSYRCHCTPEPHRGSRARDVRTRLTGGSPTRGAHRTPVERRVGTEDERSRHPAVSARLRICSHQHRRPQTMGAPGPRWLWALGSWWGERTILGRDQQRRSNVVSPPSRRQQTTQRALRISPIRFSALHGGRGPFSASTPPYVLCTAVSNPTCPSVCAISLQPLRAHAHIRCILPEGPPESPPPQPDRQRRQRRVHCAFV